MNFQNSQINFTDNGKNKISKFIRPDFLNMVDQIDRNQNEYWIYADEIIRSFSDPCLVNRFVDEIFVDKNGMPLIDYTVPIFNAQLICSVTKMFEEKNNTSAQNMDFAIEVYKKIKSYFTRTNKIKNIYLEENEDRNEYLINKKFYINTNLAIESVMNDLSEKTAFAGSFRSNSIIMSENKLILNDLTKYVNGNISTLFHEYGHAFDKFNRITINQAIDKYYTHGATELPVIRHFSECFADCLSFATMLYIGIPFEKLCDRLLLISYYRSTNGFHKFYPFRNNSAIIKTGHSPMVYSTLKAIMRGFDQIGIPKSIEECVEFAKIGTQEGHHHRFIVLIGYNNLDDFHISKSDFEKTLSLIPSSSFQALDKSIEKYNEYFSYEDLPEDKKIPPYETVSTDPMEAIHELRLKELRQYHHDQVFRDINKSKKTKLMLEIHNRAKRFVKPTHYYESFENLNEIIPK